MIRSKWILVLVGDNDTGKTTVQKHLVKLLTDKDKDDRLECDLDFRITKTALSARLDGFSVGNRSFQEREKRKEYSSVEDYFAKDFNASDFCVLSSHLVIDDLQAMIGAGHRRFYNVAALFFTNSIAKDQSLNADASELPWDERFVASNNETEDREARAAQLIGIAESLVALLLERSKSWIGSPS